MLEEALRFLRYLHQKGPTCLQFVCERAAGPGCLQGPESCNIVVGGPAGWLAGWPIGLLADLGGCRWKGLPSEDACHAHGLHTA